MKNNIEKYLNKKIKFILPNTVFIGKNVDIEDGVTIYPNVYIDNAVVIKKNSTIQMNSYIANNVLINENVFIGQNTIIRDKTTIGKDSVVGPHSEITRSNLGTKCIIGHKNFIGDAILMDNVKFGAGAIIANSNWLKTFKTTIGANTKIGCNATLVSPLNIGNDCFISAGSLIKNDVESNKFIKTNIDYEVRENNKK